jgi:hypothetical protein
LATKGTGGILVGRPLPLVIGIVFLGLAVACSGGGAQPEPEVVHVGARWAFDPSADVSALATSSDIVFVGKIESVSGQRYENSYLQGAVSNPIPGKPTPDLTRGFPVTAFNVSVSEALSGDVVAGQQITIEQPGGLTTGPDGNEVVVLLEGDEPVEVGGTYLLFVQRKPNGSYNTPPYARFAMNEGSFQAIASWSGFPAAETIEGVDIAQLRLTLEATQ